jgi:uncharacterized protein
MNSFEAIDALRRSEQALRERGVTHAALFGSLARGDNRSNSDIDIMIEIDPNARMTVFEYADLKDCIAALFGEPVDVVNRTGLKPFVPPRWPMPSMRSESARGALGDILHHIDPAASQSRSN